MRRAQIAREGPRARAASALEKAQGGKAWVKLVREGGELMAADAGRILGDSLPSGLRLLLLGSAPPPRSAKRDAMNERGEWRGAKASSALARLISKASEKVLASREMRGPLC